MTGIDHDDGTSLRTAVFERAPDNVLTGRMRPQVPTTGLVSGRVRSTHPLPRSACRLLDSRVLEAALRFLDQDPHPLLLTGLARYRALTDAARQTLATPGRDVVVTLATPYRVTSEHHPEVAVIIDGTEAGTVEFDLDVAFEMGETSLAVRKGAIAAVDCVAGSVTLDLSLAQGERLLHGTRRFPVHQDVDPPIPIPVLPRDL
ncbi:hypothetical protein [Rhodococcus sp. NPDC059234]|uniref:hypothetical protein n=1 Tax=Rhodococcus sp. NPDC059234 TaxID=3346781 RepID=UPI003670695D